jgi:hypothetical protein
MAETCSAREVGQDNNKAATEAEIYCHILGVCATYKTGFGFEFIGPLYNLLQHFRNHYLRLDTLDFWPHYTNPLLQLKCQLLLASRYGSDHAENTSIAYQRMPSIVEYSLPRDVSTESLPSNGSMRHNIYIYIHVYLQVNSKRKLKHNINMNTLCRKTVGASDIKASGIYTRSCHCVNNSVSC